MTDTTAQAQPSARASLRGYGLVILAAVLWATMGLFYKRLIDGFGLTPLAAAFFRAMLAALLILGWQALKGRRVWRLAWRDVRFYALFGLIGIGVFYPVYASAVDQVGVGVASVLMYTAPAWVTVLSALFLGESWSLHKGLALALVIAGIALVARVYDPAVFRLNVPGVLTGLGAGLTYGLYTLFSKLGVRRHEPLTVLGYALFFGTLVMLPFQSAPVIVRGLTEGPLLLWLLGFALGPTLLAGLAFMAGLRHLPASNASIVATLEPVMALYLGAITLGEAVEGGQLVGTALVLLAVVLINLGDHRRARRAVALNPEPDPAP